MDVSAVKLTIVFTESKNVKRAAKLRDDFKSWFNDTDLRRPFETRKWAIYNYVLTMEWNGSKGASGDDTRAAPLITAANKRPIATAAMVSYCTSVTHFELEVLLPGSTRMLRRIAEVSTLKERLRRCLARDKR